MAIGSALQGSGRPSESIITKAKNASKNLSSQLSTPALINRYRLVVDNAVSKARNFAQVLSYQELGITRYEYSAIIDHRTSNICLTLNGKVVEVKYTSNYVEKVLSTDPEKVVSSFPWSNPNQWLSTPDERAKADWKGLLDKSSVKLPPFHAFCRTMVIVSDRKETLKSQKETLQKEIGIPNIEFGSCDNTDLIENLIDGFRIGKKFNMSMPYSLKIDESLMNKFFGKDSKDVPACFIEPKYSPKGETMILINDKQNYFYNPIKSAKKDKAKKIASTDYPNHLILHELGHLELFEKNLSTYRDKNIESKSLKDLIKEKVSDIASGD